MIHQILSIVVIFNALCNTQVVLHKLKQLNLLFG